IASDAGQDENHDFDDFSKLYRRMRLCGICFKDLQTGEPLSLAALKAKGKQRRASVPFIEAKIVYPDGFLGILFYVKPCFTDDKKEDLALKNSRLHFPSFPPDPTSNVVYEPNQVESYRQLGESIGLLFLPRVRERLEQLDAADFGAPEPA